jgi:hypothetical protein
MYTKNKIETFQKAYRQEYEFSQRHLIICLLITALLCLTAASKTASAATYYLDAVNGDDGNPGTSEQPWRTLSKAQSVASEGDTVYLRNGNYGAFSDETSVRTDWLTYKADAGHTPIFTHVRVGQWTGPYNLYLHFEGITITPGYPPDGATHGVDAVYANYIKFVNVSIIGTSTYTVSDGSAAFFLRDASDIVIDRCTVNASSLEPDMGFEYGVYGTAAFDIDVLNCDIQRGRVGIRAGGTGWLIEGNHVHNIDSDGLWLVNFAYSMIKNNHIEDIGPREAFFTYSGGCHYNDSTKTITANEGNPWQGVHIETVAYKEYIRITPQGESPTDWYYINSSIANTITLVTAIGQDYPNISLIELRHSYHADGIQAFNSPATDPDAPGFRYIEYLTFTGNHIHDIIDQGIWLNVDLGSEYITIENNLLYDCYGTNATIGLFGTRHLRFNNNTVPGYQEESWTPDNGGKVYVKARGKINSTIDEFCNNIVDMLDIDVDSGGVEEVNYANYNIACKFWVGMDTYNRGANTVNFNGNLTGFKGVFADYDKRDFTLTEGAIAIDFGNADYAPNSDILGVSRSIPPDAGCYEYVDPNSKSYSIIASFGKGGQIIPSGTTQVVSGDSQTYSITKNTGYNISDVVVDGSSVGNVDSYNFKNVTADHTIAATFAAIDTYTITTSARGGGTVSNPGEGQFSYDHGSEVSIEAMAYPNYHFVNWTGTAVDAGKVTDPSDDSTKVTMDADYTIQANFAILPPDNKPPDISPIPDTLTKNEGETVTSAEVELAQDPDGDTLTYTYSGWLTSLPYTTTYDDVGTHTLHVDVSDGTDTTGKDITITVTADTSAPSVANCAPAVDSIQAPLNTLVILHVVDDGKGVDPESVTININDDPVYSGNTATHSSAHGKCHRIGTKANYTFIYQPKENFEFDESVSVKVNATDMANNPMAEYSYSFKTEMLSFGKNKRVDLRDVKKGRPVTVCDNSGNIWAAWHAGVVDSRDIYIGKLEDGAVNFDSSVQLTSDAAECNPVTATGSDGKLYVAWQDNRNGNWDIYVSTSNDWSAEIRVTDSNDNQINPAIVVDSSLPNNAYIVWEDDRNGNQDIYVATSSDGFATKTVSPITSNGSDQVEPAIAADSDNTIYVVWTDTRIRGKKDIYGAASNDGPWTNIPIVTEEESQSSPAIATEAVGAILHLVWVDDRTTDGDDDIFYAKTTGGLTPLTGSSIIDDDTGADQISPVIITTGYTGNDLKVFACWRDERNANADLYLAEISSDYSAKISSGDAQIQTKVNRQ